jgi:hypothetical protein
MKKMFLMLASAAMLVSFGCGAEVIEDDGADGASVHEDNLADAWPSAHILCAPHERGARCVQKCITTGLDCPLATKPHPFKRNVGRGSLFVCDGTPQKGRCGYAYPNREDCDFFYGSGQTPKCIYQGG